jgi:hypothetical protein
MSWTLPRPCTSPKTSGHAADDKEERATTAASSCDDLIVGVGSCGGGGTKDCSELGAVAASPQQSGG